MPKLITRLERLEQQAAEDPRREPPNRDWLRKIAGDRPPLTPEESAEVLSMLRRLHPQTGAR